MDNIICDNAYALVKSGHSLNAFLKTVNGYLAVVAGLMTLGLVLYLAWVLPDLLFTFLKSLCKKPKNDGAGRVFVTGAALETIVKNHQNFCIIFLSTLHETPNQTLNDFWNKNRHLIRAI